MKKIIKLAILSILLIMLGACSSMSKKDKNDITQFKDIRATFVTSQGDISFYLYPEAAPVTVANFVNLALKGYYDNTTFHRAVENFIIQGGDPTGTGRGTAGYTIEDEFVEWLDFYQPGVLAMANAGPKTGSAQFFITLYPAEFLNNKHTVFGEVVSLADSERSKKLEKGDVIKEVIITGNYELLLAMYKDRILEWNSATNKEYPNLKSVPIKDVKEFGDLVAVYQSEIKRVTTPREIVEEDEFEYPVPKAIRWVEGLFRDDEESITE